MANKQFTMHYIGFPHLPLAKKYLSCAFTQKNLKLCKMLTSLGHTVNFYGVRSTEEEPIENYINSDNFHFIEIHTVQDIAKAYGEADNRFELGYDFVKKNFITDYGNKNQLSIDFCNKVADKINAVKKPDDFLLNIMGYAFKPIADKVNLFLDCEPGIGYHGSYPHTKEKPHFRGFESAHVRDIMYGFENPFKGVNGSHYDRVIPNYFDLDDFEFRAEKDDYYVYIGRMIARKGIAIATTVCNAIGKKLIIAGPSAKVLPNGTLNSGDLDIPAGSWEYVGFADSEKRKELLAGAIATFVPSVYQEPFAGTHVESRLSGTPVLTTNFGVFSGTVENGVDGYACDTIDDFVWGAKHCKDLDPYIIRKRAERYSMDNVKWEFQKWFEDLHDLYLSTTDKKYRGWGTVRKEEPEFRKHLFYNNKE